MLVEVLDDGTPTPAPRVQPTSIAPLPPVVAPAASAPAPAAAPAAGAGDVISPLAGKVVSIDVKVGDTVAAGAQVATVEAMKMNTYIYASAAGAVSAIHVAPGDGVEEGAPLLRIG